jgi:hypothetical protein
MYGYEPPVTDVSKPNIQVQGCTFPEDLELLQHSLENLTADIVPHVWDTAKSGLTITQVDDSSCG